MVKKRGKRLRKENEMNRMIRDVKSVIKDKQLVVSSVVPTMLSECYVLLLLSLTASAKPTLNLSKGCQCAIRKVIAESGTGPCPRSCSKTYQPVCGFNPCEEDDYPDMMFRTFDNECELEATICDGPGFLYQRVYPGTCVMDHQDDTSCLFVPD